MKGLAIVSNKRRERRDGLPKKRIKKLSGFGFGGQKLWRKEKRGSLREWGK